MDKRGIFTVVLSWFMVASNCLMDSLLGIGVHWVVCATEHSGRSQDLGEHATGEVCLPVS